MRTECKHYETRAYATGETVRKCNLDLAPEAPWRCPENCPGFDRRLAAVNWEHASLIAPPTPAEPPGLGDGTAAALLDEAEEIVNAALPSTLQDMKDRGRSRPRLSADGDEPWWRRFGRRR